MEIILKMNSNAIKWHGHIDWKYIKRTKKGLARKLKTYPYFNLKKFMVHDFKKIKMVLF